MFGVGVGGSIPSVKRHCLYAIGAVLVTVSAQLGVGRDRRGEVVVVLARADETRYYSY